MRIINLRTEQLIQSERSRFSPTLFIFDAHNKMVAISRRTFIKALELTYDTRSLRFFHLWGGNITVLWKSLASCLKYPNVWNNQNNYTPPNALYSFLNLIYFLLIVFFTLKFQTIFVQKIHLLYKVYIRSIFVFLKYFVFGMITCMQIQNSQTP